MHGSAYVLLKCHYSTRTSAAAFDGSNIPLPAKCAWIVYVPGDTPKGPKEYEPAASVNTPGGVNGNPVNVISPGTPEPVQVSVNVPVSAAAPGDGDVAVNVKRVGCMVGVHGEVEAGEVPCEIVFDEDVVHEPKIGDVPPAVSHACP